MTLTPRSRTSIRRAVPLGLAAVAALSLGACSPSSDPVASCSVVIDVTGYPGTDWTIQQITNNTEQLKDSCMNGVSGVSLITVSSSSSTCPKQSVDTTIGEQPNEKAKIAATTTKWNEFLDALNNTIDCGKDNVNPGGGKGSDILGGIRDGAQQLASAPDGSKTMVVLSDMIHNKPELNVKQLEADPAPAVQRLRSAGLVADLSGVDVTVVGLGAKNSSLSNEQLARVETFWRAYLDAAGAGSSMFVPNL